MKRKSTRVIIYGIIITILSFPIGIMFHELGHALMAIIVKIPVLDIHVGITSYTMIDSDFASDVQISFITIGSFIFPELIYMILLLFSNIYVSLFRVITGIANYVNFIYSIVILFTGSNEPETWDILLFQEYSGINKIVIIIVLLVITIFNITCEIKKSWVQELFYID